MQNPHFSENCVETLFLTHHSVKYSFQERVVFHEWIWCKICISARVGKNVTKRCYQLTMAQNTVFKKELYFMTGFNAKPISQRELVKILRNAVFNPQWSKTQFSRKSYIAWLTGFDAKRKFQREMVKTWGNALMNPQCSKTQFWRKICIPWVDLMQNAFLRVKW